LRIRLRVKEIAEQKGYSMGKLERLADLSHPTIRDIFRNPYKEVTTTTLAKLATALNVHIAELYEEISDKEDIKPEV
jgi:transcriptional regulator with XRE-family HTH domain